MLILIKELFLLLFIYISHNHRSLTCVSNELNTLEWLRAFNSIFHRYSLMKRSEFLVFCGDASFWHVQTGQHPGSLKSMWNISHLGEDSFHHNALRWGDDKRRDTISQGTITSSAPSVTAIIKDSCFCCNCRLWITSSNLCLSRTHSYTSSSRQPK